MYDFDAMHVIEALRSGVPSRAVGEYFSEGRPGITKKITERMEQVRATGRSDGMIFTGRYGEGKTHMLNTLFSRATSSNMVVSLVSLGKETPIDKLHLLYPKIIANTWLPGAGQPGFRSLLETRLTAGSGPAGELLGYSGKVLGSDKLYYLLKAFVETQDEEEQAAFLGDLEGDFVTAAAIKRSYRRSTGTVAKMEKSFRKTKDCMDYFRLMSYLFRVLGYDGWLLLFDEAELIGRMGKKTRMKSYRMMDAFLNPGGALHNTFAVFAMSASYAEDVIDKKHDLDLVQEVYGDEAAATDLAAAKRTLDAILAAPELAPLTKAEIGRTLMRIQQFHGMAYDWNPQLSEETLMKATDTGGYLLRTKIRAAIELLDQLFQYGEAGETKIGELGAESFEEVPEVEEAYGQLG